MARQNPVSLQIPIIPDSAQVEAVTKKLNELGNPYGIFKKVEKPSFPLDELGNVHFARWLVVPADQNLNLSASLIYAANVDGNGDQHLEDLLNNAPLTEGLDSILEHCVSYPEKDARNKASRLAYLKQHSLSTPGFYVGAPKRTVDQIHNEEKLHTALRDFVKANEGKWSTSRQAYEAIQEFLGDDPQWDWARETFQLPKTNYVKLVLLGLFLLLILPFLLLFLVLIHFFYERRAKPFGKTVNQIPLEHLKTLKDQEDIIYQNQLSQLFVTIGGLRKLGLHFFLWLTTFLGKNQFAHGQLLGTPTIHFARWVLIDKGKRFVFFSNFDGSFDEYLGDFVDNSGWGLNAIYGASKGYPRTFFVFGKGAYIILEFMGWGRYTQVPTQMWYSAYPWNGLQQIVSKSQLRVDLFNSGQLNDTQIQDMLRRI
ncbi:MAG: hypothetical protein AAF587_10750 [Bacteroidota bacterium]